jgi:hypothetical protein
VSRLTSSDSALLVEKTAQAGTAVITSDAMQTRSTQMGVTVYTYSNQAGSLQLQVYLGPSIEVDPNNMDEASWHNLAAARVITANTLDIVTFNQGLPPIRAVYTPTAGPHTTRVLVKAFGGD